MADDANALMPEPEHLPTEADYEAICATVMQTARGRWFLAEYARRNRNADTRMVLDAVARIEGQMARTPAPAEPPKVDHGPAIADAMAQARARIAAVIAADAPSAALDVVRMGVASVREVTWTLREWGIDSELCDRLDTHSQAILDNCEAAARTGLGEAILAVFDGRQHDIDTLLVPAVAAPAPALPSAAPTNVSAVVATLKPETLGAALLTQGLVTPPRGGDPLAPLRRMTQAEKVALFT